MERNKFIFYKDWWETLKQMPPEMAQSILEAIMDYAFQGIKPADPAIALYSMFPLVSNQIKRDQEKYEGISQKRREAGRKGGAKMGNQNASKQAKQASACFDKQNEQNKQNEQLQAKQAKQANNIDIDIDSDKDIDSNSDININTTISNKRVDAPKGAARFIKPTIGEIEEYISEKGWLDIDAEHFHAFYESNGWKVGRSPMKNWKAALVNWHKRNTSNNYANGNNHYTRSSYEDARKRGEEEAAEFLEENIRNLGVY